MALADAPFGLRPHNLIGNSPNSNGLTRYMVQSTVTAGSSSAIFQGDLVLPLENGLVGVEDGAGTETNLTIGVMAGCEYINNNGEPVFDNNYPGAASVKDNTYAYIFVYDNPMQIFEIQGDGPASGGTSRANLEGMIHGNAQGTGFGSQTGSTGISTGELDASTGDDTTATDIFQVVGIKNLENLTDAEITTGTGIIYLVRINTHRYLSQGAGL